MVLLISALSIFPDSKRLQDRSINGLYAIFPYLAAIPLQFHFVPEFLLKIYIICTWILKAYIFVNTGILKGEDKPNKYGEIDDFKGDYKEKVSVVENDKNKDAQTQHTKCFFDYLYALNESNENPHFSSSRKS